MGLMATGSTLLTVEQRHTTRLWVAVQQACPDGVAALQIQVTGGEGSTLGEAAF